jgi:hypothetical protein
MVYTIYRKQMFYNMEVQRMWRKKILVMTILTAAVMLSGGCGKEESPYQSS